MTTTNLEKKLKISENTAIHCPTEEEANEVLKIFHKLGLTWFTGHSIFEINSWERKKELTCYIPCWRCFSGVDEIKLFGGNKVISAQDFLKLHHNKKRWRAKKGEPYFLLMTDRLTETEFHTGRFIDTFDTPDDDRYKQGNYFRTKREAQKVADKINNFIKEALNDR